MHLDKITEAIAHFVGLFQIETEQARLRSDYLEFKALRAQATAPDQHDRAELTFQSPYNFNDPDPGLHYVPAAPTIEPLTVATNVTYAMPQIPVPGEIEAVIYPGFMTPRLLQQDLHTGTRIIELAPPGSVAVHISQINSLSDNDFVNIGTDAVAFHSIGTPNLTLDTLLSEAAKFVPIEAATFASAHDIGDFIADTGASLHAFAAQANGSTTETADGVSIQTNVTVIDAPENNAVYVNGHMQSEAPKLEDVLPAASPLVKDDVATPDDAPGNNHLINGPGSTATGGVAHGEGAALNASSVEISTGANALVNTATLVNDAIEGNVFAVAGNHFALNAIIQVNAWSDCDSIGASLNNWDAAGHAAATATFNIASFQHIDTGGDLPGTGDPAQMTFPKAWAVTEIHGDFVSMNWIQQLNFIIDNDNVVSASSSGVMTKLGTGENQGLNDLSIADLGRYYDLILIGGHYYDANIITQTNVLLDDDIVGAVSGFHTSGQGSVSGSDNLLWNNAAITSIGHDTTGALPTGYSTALDGFAAGNHTLPSSVLADGAFEGLSGLKVLYISGSVYDLQYVSQTNVLGDADHIALAMNSAEANLDASWTITTGSNALLNSAQIIDVDPAGKIYVGGDHYSDELLVQTDIIRTDHLLEGKDADHLVNEAVAFLSDDMMPTQADDASSHLRDAVSVHPAHSDIMQSVVS